MVAKEKARFPKWWHGGFLIVVGMAVGFMGAAGWLGRVGGPDGLSQALGTLGLFLFVGFCITLLGFILLIWSARRSLRGDAHAASVTPKVVVKELSQRDESSTLRNLFLVTIAAVLLGATSRDRALLLSTGSPFHPLSPIRKVMSFSCAYLLLQLPFLIALVRLREKVDRLAIAILLAYSCVSILASAQVFSFPSYLLSWKGLLPASQIAVAVVAWQARNTLPRRDGETSLFLACFVVSLVYLKLHFWLNPRIYFRF